MSGDHRLEEQIKQFYDNVPEVDDALPMKDYLLKHENNQMAWYLLGKQYAAKGEEGKANYCFAQAGPVFEAFESRANPLASAGAFGKPSDDSRPPRRRRLAAGAAGAIALLLGLLLAGGRVSAPDTSAAVSPGGAGAPPATASQPAAAAAPMPAAGSPEPKLADVAGSADAGTDGAGALGQLLTKTPAAAHSLLVQTPLLDKRWVDWLKSGEPIAAVTASSSDSAAGVAWYDPTWCPCRLGQDASKARETVAAWRPLQESKLVLRSAMIAYRNRNGKWPSSKEDLAGAYPANTIAGWTEEMASWLGELKQQLEREQADGQPPSPGWPDASGPKAGNGEPAGKLAALTEKPLEVVVDKKRHRLAVVSGNVLLRNYEVGLGGDKTPVGQFVITEKVRDPNGRTDGEFGSRGMTLSDTLYAIHGTDEPDSIGADESHGCVRMKREDLEELYDLVSVGTRVTIIEEGLPDELRAPAERFRLKPAQNETNPHKTYHWLN